ncbi:hypothetical protein Tsp_11128 [Trichinella spiralis]|uniref:hypothetical protein n=1 Tax=Trichinella spiralis TaxID=6334 RepID=UPI0001EFEAD7|nr:hypothetical protein Tsp_11128 [Trichinella spiralis]
MEAQEQKGGEEVSRVRIRHASWTNKTRHSDIQFDVGQKFAFEKVGRVCWENWCKTGKPWKESAFVAATGILYLLIRLTRECENWQKIIRRLVVRKQAQKAKITNDIKIYLEFRHESQSNELKVFIADDSRLDCIAASMLTVKLIQVSFHIICRNFSRQFYVI